MEKAIVFGANGFIGQYLVQVLSDEGVEVFALVRKGATQLRTQNSNVYRIEYDESNLDSIVKELNGSQYDVSINLAWEGVAGNKRGDYDIQLNNVRRTLKFMEISTQLKCKRFIGISSVSELECALYMPKDKVKVGKRFIYSTAKQTSHYMCKCLANDWGIEYINVNVANLYGEYGIDLLILHDSIIKMLKGEVTEFTSGEQWYDFAYVEDVANAIYNISQKGQNGCSYYIGSGKPRKLKEYLIYIGNLICPGKDIGLGKRASDGMDLPLESFNIDKLVKDTCWQPKYEYEDKIIDVIDYYKMNL